MGRGLRARRAAAAGALVVMAMVTAACADSDGTGSGGSDESTPPAAESTGEGKPPPIDEVTLTAGAVGSGVPEDAMPPGDSGAPGAGWTADEGLLYVVTFGSSTCPITAEPEATLTEGSVQVELADVPDGPCTMDFVPTTSVVSVPSDVDESAQVQVFLDDQEVLVEPRPAEGEPGPIAWAAAG